MRARSRGRAVRRRQTGKNTFKIADLTEKKVVVQSIQILEVRQLLADDHSVRLMSRVGICSQRLSMRLPMAVTL
jgi:hypothetical protein